MRKKKEGRLERMGREDKDGKRKGGKGEEEEEGK